MQALFGVQTYIFRVMCVYTLVMPPGPTRTIPAADLPRLIVERRGTLTLAQYARAIGISRPALSAMLHGRRPPSAALLKALGVVATTTVYEVKE